MRHLGVAAILLKTTLMRRRLPFLALLLLGTAGLSACSTSTNPTLITPATATDVFASRIQQHGSAWRSESIPTAGSVTIQLSSVSQADAVVALSLGTINGSSCVPTQSVQTAANSAANSPQITANLAIGTYCVQVSDIGNLTTIVDFTVLVIRPY